MTTDQQLKLALAKEFPKLIEIEEIELPPSHPDNPTKATSICFLWKDTRFAVTDREWDWVVNQLIRKLTNVRKIGVLVKMPTGPAFGPAIPYMESTWQQRAITYFKTIGKEIV